MGKVSRIPTGLKQLDEILGGGIERSIITEVYGEAGSGKTNFSLWCLKRALEIGGFGIFIDTEGLSPERLSQIFSEREELLDNCMIVEARDLRDLKDKVAKAYKLIASSDRDPQILILDSFGMAYRRTLASGIEGTAAVRVSYPILVAMMDICQETGCACLITNQVYSSLAPDRDLIALGGEPLKHFAKAIIRLEKTGVPGERVAVLEKHRSLPEGKKAYFKITERGLEEISRRELPDLPRILAPFQSNSL